jgi:uncharacterized protein YeaO (DUF488 family)
MYVNDKRWNDPFDPDDGHRVLICRIRPRGLPKSAQTWHAWEQALAPSRPLLKAFQSAAVDWPRYRARFLAEMQSDDAQAALGRLASIVEQGRPVTLLCAASCHDRERCHRSLVRALLEGQLKSRASM